LKVNLEVEARLIEKHNGYLRKVAFEYAKKTGQNVDDLFQLACIGMINGIRRYDKSKGFKLLTYCQHYIKREFSYYLSDNSAGIKYPINLFYNKEFSKNRIKIYSYDVPVNDTTPSTFKDIMVDDKLIEQGHNPSVKQLLEPLNDKEKYIIYHRYILGNTLKEIGDALNFTRERIRQLENGALNKMRKHIKKKGLV
jgi:RNA polymerase sigma factor (sigma-70 family)